uniref:Transmembrane 9 superfamily member n=1 Tax=Saccoglossus kowalevskii TaxID=10224 RepID=A0ABM0H166_SACKO|nr:PREDICTED: transmembrane 9 superfamily member 2-like [Saccoglossus kowalevskii]
MAREEKDVKWSHRWNYVMDSLNHNNLNLFSIMNSGLITAFFTGGITILSYKVKASRNKNEESSGWPQIKEDVFRTPLGYLAISVIVGNGVQVIITTLLVISFATLGTISPANPGSISMTILIGYVTLGSCPAGYTTAKLYKMWGGEHWKLTTALTATLLPAMAIFQLLLCNIIFVVTGSSSVLPWTTGIAVLSIWIFGNVPLVVFGGFFAQKQKRVWHPVPPSDIRRFMPSRACYRKIAVLIIKLFCGAIPFSVIFIQLFFILNSLWNNQIYYSYGYLAIQVAILCVLCAEISIVFTYLQLSAENYRWSWNSFITTGFGAVYFFVYCVYFYINKTEAQDPFSFVIYFSYTSLMAIVFLLFTGSIGFIAALVFVRKLYMPYATEYYQKPLNRVVAKELKDVEANVEILETIEQEAEEVNLTAENFKHHQPAEEEEKLLA